MKLYYSASLGDGRGGFCPDNIYGPRQIDVVDEEKLAEHVARAQEKDEAEFEAALAADRGEDDPRPVRQSYRRRERLTIANPPMKQVANPDCRLPADAVEVKVDEYDRLMHAQAEGNEIVPGTDGRPMSRPRETTVDQLLATVRAKRDRELKASDWTQMGDSPLSAAKKKLWAEHRAALRDLPKTVEVMLKKADNAAAVDLTAVIPQAPE